MRLAFRVGGIPIGLGTDTSRDYEYIDWNLLEEFAAEFGVFVEYERAASEVRLPNSHGTGGRIVLLMALGLGLAGVVFWARKGRREGTDGVGTEDSGIEVERPREPEVESRA
jgi:hypothetical protein